MKFGKEFTSHLQKTLPEWRGKFLCYKLLKKLLKNIPSAAADDGDAAASVLPLPELQVRFVAILCQELKKFDDFYVEKEEEFVIRFRALKERTDVVKQRSSRDGVLASEPEFSEDIMAIRKDWVLIHGEMVLLKNYSSLNFVGLIKILKKYDKRTGARLSLPFIQLAFYQPFFTTELLSRLVRECEANLKYLFPQEGQATATSADISTSRLGEETVEIYLSTVAAISAIQGLRRASSTYNPLSLSYIFGSQDNDSTGG